VADQFRSNDGTQPRLNPEAFAACFEQFSAGVRAVLRSKLGNEADVDDCFSRVFEKLWIHGEKVNPAARGSWLYVVARREAALQWRKQKRAEELLDGFAGEFDELRENHAPEDGLIQAEIADRLRLAADKLSKEQQDVLRKRFYEDMSFREIAEELGIPLGTALTRLHAALKRLRSVLDE
jgi:RNA polymerase sigma factor (sigma-70 family)